MVALPFNQSRFLDTVIIAGRLQIGKPFIMSRDIKSFYDVGYFFSRLLINIEDWLSAWV